MIVSTDKETKQTETPKNTKIIKTTTTTRKVTKIASDTPVVDKVIPKTYQSNDEQKVVNETNLEEKIDTPKKSFNAIDIANRLKNQTAIVKEHENKKSQDFQANQNKLSHLNALNSKIKNKETNEKMQINSKSLGEMLSRIHSANVNNSSKTSFQKIETSVSKQESNNIDIQKSLDTKKSAKPEKIEKKEKPKKEKKSLFGWLLGKK